MLFTFVITATLPNIINAATNNAGNPQQQLEEIEKYISQQRQSIEDFYAGKLIELQLREEEEIRLLEAAEKGNFASLAAQARIAETVLGVEEEHKPKGSFEDTIDKSPRRFAAAQNLIAEKKNAIFAAYDTEIAKLEIQKRYALTVRLPELEKKLKESITAAKPAVTNGLVTGIVYCEAEPAAIIDGQVVHQKNAIHNVNVTKIAESTVEFEKNGQRWSQKVAETPNALW